MNNTGLVKTENPHFMKSEETGALVSNDLSAFNKHKLDMEHKEKTKTQESDLNNIKSEVFELKSEMRELKDMLRKLLTE